MNTKEPTFMIGSVPIFGDLILAPMDGITDNPFRALCRGLGSAMVVTEFINALDVIEDNPRYPKRTIFTEDQRPVSLQILGNDPERMLTAAVPLVEDVKPDILDINLGCQSKNVTSRGAGAALLRKPEDIARIFALMTREFTIPVTGKIRLGWDDGSLNYLEVAKIIEDNGGAMVAVHGRTRKQAYRGQAIWEPIREVKQALHIPVIGNGDVVTVADIERIKQETGCDAVMIGRAAVSNPWIFSRLDRDQVSPQDALQTILTHFKTIVAHYGEQGVITFRKYLKAYLAPYSIPREELLALLKEKDQDVVHSEITRIFSLL
ncbi:tRNA-dihydrouridine synthase family protein [Chloroflexota bacterium]|nr:tRNA-dihydrouridine synthase family protein [Chloroflexota bacterium]